MIRRDRRFLSLVIVLSIQLICLGNETVPNRPPVARVEPVQESLFGTTVTDPYRWMENDKDPDWDPFMRGQGAFARKHLDAIPLRAEIGKRVSELSGDLEAINTIQTAGSRLFVERRPPGANNFMLFVRESFGGRERLLFDPETRTKGDVHSALNYWSVSPDGKWVALGISASGSESAVIEIMSVDDGSVLPERIDRAQYAFPSWLPDSSGFFIMRLAPGRALGAVDYYDDIVTWLHKLRTDPGADIKVLGGGMFDDVPMTPVEAATVVPVQGTDFVIATVGAGVQAESTLYINSLANAASGRGGWQRFTTTDDEVTGYATRGEEIYLLTHKNAPRFRVLRVTTKEPSLAKAVEIVPESKAIIQGLYVGKDALFIHDLVDGVDDLRRRSDDGTIRTLALPYAGSINTVSGDPELDGLIFGLQSWLEPNAIFRAGAGGRVASTDLAAKSGLDTSAFESVEVLAKGKDGVTVPLSIVYKKGIKRDGSAPTILTGYGAYGLSSRPTFQPMNLAFLERGGIWAVAHVRGGGERGEEWHQAGRLLNKHHSWEDLIACAEFLVDGKWTSPGKLAIHGRSAGGITMGRAMTERPDLFAVAISNVGVLNSLRGEFTPNGPANTPEFGSVKTADGFKGLRSMDSLSHVKKGVKYPAVLLTTGMTDRRVSPWLVSKFAAQLQASTGSGKPVLLSVDFQAGHGIGSTRAQRDNEIADMFAFVLEQTKTAAESAQGTNAK
jgi:prolyl oligopeptidase